MRASVVIAAVAVLGVAAGGGYYGLEIYPQQLFRAGLDQTLATLPPGTTASYRAAHYAIRSGLAVVSGLTVHTAFQGDPPRPLDITVESVELTAPDLDFSGAWAKALAAPQALTPDMALPLADTLALKGVTIRSAASVVTEETVLIGKPRLYPWALSRDGMPSWMEFQEAIARAAKSPDLTTMQPILRAEAGFMLGFGCDRYDIGATTATDAAAGIDIAYAVRKTSGGAFDRGVVSEGSAEGITVSTRQLGTVSIDRVTIGAIDLRQTLTRLLTGEPLSLALLDGGRIGRIAYDGITARPPGQPETHAGGVSIGPVAFAQGMPVSGEAAWKDVTITRAQLPDATARDVMEQIGLETMTTSFTTSYDWNVAEKRMSVRDTTLKVNELGTLTASADLTDFVADVAGLGQARLVHATLRLDDASLVDRLLRAGAARSRTDLDAYRRRIVAIVRLGLSPPANDSPALAAARQAVGGFITSPHSLTTELAPAEPVPVLALAAAATANPAKLATLLGLRVAASQK